MEQFRNLAGRQRELPRIPGGNPGSDGDVIRQAMTEESEAKEAFIAALERLNRFVESGMIPAGTDDPESGGTRFFTQR